MTFEQTKAKLLDGWRLSKKGNRQRQVDYAEGTALPIRIACVLRIEQRKP
jgi:hypothetical protein